MNDGRRRERRERFAAIVDVVYEPLQRYLRRRVAATDVPDLLDDVLLVLWRRLDDVPTDASRPWTYGVARNAVANHRRSERRRSRLVRRIESGGQHRQPPQPTWTSPVEEELWRALGALRPNDRELLRLWAWERLEPAEIALVLDTTPNAIHVRLARLRSTLRSTLARQDRGGAGHVPDGQRREDAP